MQRAVSDQGGDRYSRLPDALAGAVRKLHDGDPAGLELAVAYLVQRPYFFGSGYVFEEVAAAVAIGPDAGRLARDIREVVLREARRRGERETRYVARLAGRYWNDSLSAGLAAIPGPTAAFIVERAQEVRSSYRGLGLVASPLAPE
ncbi:MAG TPA: hypothetical protein PKA93_08315 [Arachnia sp.]|nr:hypothetical protein [Arachnia sp.]